MDGYEMGYRILNLRTGGTNAGQKGTVVGIDYDTDEVVVEYDNGNIGRSDEPRRYYKIISRGSGADTASPAPTKQMNNILTFVRETFMSADEKAMRKAGLKTDCGTYTEAAKALVIEKLCRENEATLIENAKAFLEEEKANKQ
jgi:uncharacterized protein YuzB (UPF0349 family)